MAKKEPRCVETLGEFIEWAAQFNNGQYLFRGVSKDCYEIEASTYRRLKTNKTPAQLLKINQELIEDARSRGHDQKDGQRLSDLELLAELQHFGAATCLIDFSRNALVALWFACQPKSTRKEVNGKVFVVRSNDPVRFKTITPDLIEKRIDYFFNRTEDDYPLYQWEPKLQNNRIIAQHSVFVFGGDQIESEDECVIVQSSKQAMLKSLDQVSNITEASMYPDFDGFARLHAHDKPYIEPVASDLLRRGVEAHQRGNNADAFDSYTNVIELNQTDRFTVAEAYHNRAMIYEDRDDFKHAIADYTRAIELNPNSANSYYSRGSFYYKRGDYERAIADYTRAIELNPNNAYAYYKRGNTYEQKDEFERAIADYTRAIELDRDYVVAYIDRGVSYCKNGDYERAIADYTHAIDLNPNSASAHYNRAITWLHLEVWEKAKLDLKQAEGMWFNIIYVFGDDYGSVADFQRKTGITLPKGIVEMLTAT